MAERFKIVVVGGGLTGLAAAHAAASAGLQTLHLAPKGPPDRRTSALMMPSIAHLERSGLLSRPEDIGTPLTEIRIIDATDRLVRSPETLFASADAGLAAFGWNLPNIALTERFETAGAELADLQTRAVGLAALVRTPEGRYRLTLTDETILEADLVVGADGKKSVVRGAAGIPVRERPFRQAALVCDLTLGRPLGGTSVEFHYANGPFTLVPAGGNRANLVWIDRHETLEAARTLDPSGLAEMLETKTMGLFGPVALATPTHVFPLSTLGVARAGQDGVVLVGEAAHAFPPIGAQGLNLGLRDVADLAHVLAETPSGDDWALRVSTDYARRRAPDLARTGAMVDGLFRSLLSEMLPAQALRAGGLWALKLVPPLRRSAFGLGMGQRQK